MYRLFCLLGVLSMCWTACGDDSGTGNDNNNNNNENTTGECGDGVLNPGEACDDGADNSDALPNACRTDCRLPYCSDGVVDDGEECDDGANNSDTAPDACRTDCRTARCQDGVLDQGEGCDDGNDVAGDGCAPDCTVEAHWSCAGSPSVCDCADYYWGPGCGSCAVRVKSDVMGVIPTGADWDVAFTSVQDGINLAETLGDGCEVWVAGGTYYIWDTGPDDSVTLRSGVSLYGGFAGTETTRGQRDWAANPTVLDGMQQGSIVTDGHFVSHVVTANDTEDATVDGFVITGGWAQDSSTEQAGSGGGMLVSQFLGTADVGIANCTFHDNRVYRYGGAVAVFGGTLRVLSSAFYSNESGMDGGGIAGRTFASITVVDSTLSHNITITNTAQHGSGGGIYVDNSCSLGVVSTVFFANCASNISFPADAHGGGLRGGSSAVVRHCTFASNFTNNTATTAGSALYQTDEVTSCVFDGNSVGAVASGGTVTYSQLESVIIGQRNDTADPLLVRLPVATHFAQMLGDQGLVMNPNTVLAVGDVIEVNRDGVLRTVTAVTAPDFVFFTPTGAVLRPGVVVIENWGQGATTVDEDLSLQSSSVCIDTANDTFAPPLDRLGNPRVDVAGVGAAGTVADRGAFEYQP